MTASRTTDVDAEREVDLARWRRALVALWWIPVAGLIAGAIVGAVYSLRGGSTFKASALISLGQPTSPGGALVNGFGVNPRAVSQIVTSADARARAAAQAGLHPEALAGHVAVAQVGTATGAGAGRATPLISLTVNGSQPAKTALAANALARTVVQKTTAQYVGVKIRTFRKTLASVNTQLKGVNSALSVLNAAAKASKNLDPLQQLVIVSQADNALARVGNLIAQQEALQQQLAFATQVESAKIVEPARAVKASAHSRSSSLLVGALIGLLLGAVVAIVADGRTPATA
jgi:capsular polysaccharide biosynthesis protein